MTKDFKVLSLFSGMGGLDYGLERAGFSNVGCVEFDKNAASLLSSNRTWKIYNCDIRELKVSKVKKISQIKKGELDLLAGGPPCQSYSKSSFWNENVKRGYKDQRGKLVDDYMRFVEELLPKVFVIENVPGFCFSDQTQGLKSILRSLDRIRKTTGTNYSVNYKVLNCANYGVPQKRERFFLVANRLGVDFEFPEETHDQKDTESVCLGLKRPFITSSDVLTSLPNEVWSDCLKASGKWSDLLPCIPPGSNYQFFTEKGKGKPLFKYRSKYWTFLLKLSPNEPSWTIQASPGSSTGPFHWDNRKLSARELARIQTIPDEIKLLDNRAVMQKLIGNAVPSLMGEILGKEIRRQIFGIKSRKVYSLMPEAYVQSKTVFTVKRKIPSAFLSDLVL